MIQTVGRAARNARGEVIMYADVITGSMQRTIDETARRRDKQMAYNKAHGIVPQTVRKDVREDISPLKAVAEDSPQYLTRDVPADAKGRKQHLMLLEKAMKMPPRISSSRSQQSCVTRSVVLKQWTNNRGELWQKTPFGSAARGSIT